MTLQEGTIISGPDGMAYRVTKQLVTGDPITIDVFEPMNGAPKPVAGEPMESWLWKELERLSEQAER